MIKRRKRRREKDIYKKSYLTIFQLFYNHADPDQVQVDSKPDRLLVLTFGKRIQPEPYQYTFLIENRRKWDTCKKICRENWVLHILSFVYTEIKREEYIIKLIISINVSYHHYSKLKNLKKCPFFMSFWISFCKQNMTQIKVFDFDWTKLF